MSDNEKLSDILLLTLIKVFNRRSERKTHEMMARGVEQVASVRWVDVEENTGDHDSLFLEQFFEECLMVITINLGLLQNRTGLTNPLFNGGGSFCKFNQI